MPSFVVLPGSDALLKHFKDLVGMPRSRRYYTARLRIKGDIDGDHRQFMVAGIDSQGRKVADSAGIKARRKGIYRGKTGEPGTPSGRSSRLSRNYGSRWTMQGGAYVLVRFVANFPASRFLMRRFRFGGIRAATHAKIRRHVRDLMEWYTNPANWGKGS